MTQGAEARASAQEDLERADKASNAVYGLIVASAVLAVAPREGVWQLAGSVLATLVIYWAAERYAAVMALRIITKRGLTRGELLTQLSKGWELISASFLPIVALLLADAVGLGITKAVVAALGCSTALLCYMGWRVGGQAELPVGKRLVSSAVAGAFGLVMILLKARLHH
jgi:hypothetical protein